VTQFSKLIGDIDIDVKDRNQLLELFKPIPASRINLKEQTIEKHNSGVYFQNIPKDPFTGASSLDYEQAEQMGYLKIDFLNMYLYQEINSEQHMIDLLERPLDWDCFKNKDFVQQLYHLHNYTDLTITMAPRCMEHLAMLLAIIRPGKKHLQGKSWDTIEKTVWLPLDDGTYVFKKSHSFGYATAIYLQAQLIIEKIMENNND
jgi:DNA polymerase III alpha subunit